MKEQELLNLKKKQDEAKNKINNLKGREESVLQQMKDNWECENEQQAEKSIEEMKAEEDRLKQQYEKGTEELEKWLKEQDIDLEEL
jgi:hypothetical protein